MATLKRQKADGTWEYVQMAGQNMYDASSINIIDANGIFTSTTVEGALTEITDVIDQTRSGLLLAANGIFDQ